MRLFSFDKKYKSTLRYLSIVCIISFLAFSLGVSSFVSAPQIAYATEISDCGALSSSGTYTLTQDVAAGASPCFTVTAEAVVLDGNGHTVTGSDILISGDATSAGSSGYSFTVQNIRAVSFTTGATSNGVAGVNGSGGGSGGAITITNSYLPSVVSNGANGGVGSIASAGGSGGTGGAITISNSTITGIVNSLGAAGGAGGTPMSDAGLPGYTGGAGGVGGALAITSSTITGGITVIGGAGGVGSGGNSGNNSLAYPTDGSPGGDGGAGGAGGAGGTIGTNFSLGDTPVFNGGGGGDGGGGGAGGTGACDGEEPPNCSNAGDDGSNGAGGASGSAGSSSTGSNTADPVASLLEGTAAINGNTLTLTYGAVLLQGTTIDASQISINGSTNDCSGSSASISGNVVTVTMACSVDYQENLTMSYSPGGSGWIKDMAEQVSSGVTGEAVTNNTPDTTPPTISITTPADTTTVSAFTPSVSWGDSTTCEYKFDSDSYASLTCGSNGSDIPTPTEGAHTLTIRGSDVATNSTTAASSFTYTLPVDDTPAPTGTSNRSGSSPRNQTIADSTSPIYIANQIQSLQNIIASLTEQIQALLSTLTSPSVTSPFLSPSFFPSHTLQYRDNKPEVKDLQKFLNSHGFPVSNIGPGSPGNETTLFGLATYNALVKFQRVNGLPASGYMGPRTIEVIKKILGL